MLRFGKSRIGIDPTGSTNKNGDFSSDAFICFDTKYKSLEYNKLIDSDIDLVKCSSYRHNGRLVEWSKAHCFYAT